MTNAIKVRNVTKVYGSKRALDNVSLNIPKGQIFGFLGPNGAGKTTMIRCLMDYVRTNEGRITILGRDSNIDSAELKEVIGYLSSDIQLHPNWNSKTHIDFMAAQKGRGRADELVERFNLDLRTKVKNLSSGNKQKLAITLALLGEPKLLIMDEPTRGLDPILQNELYEVLADFSKKGGTVFLSSHNLPEVQRLCDSVAIVKDGKIVAEDTMRDILKLRTHTVSAVTNKKLKRSEFKLKNVEIINQSNKSIILKVRSNLNEVIKLLAEYDLVELQVEHANLEDIFKEYY